MAATPPRPRTLEELSADVDALSATLARLVRQRTNPPARVPRWNWSALGPDDLAAAWADLEQWVEWFTHTYRLEDRLPDDWREDDGLVQELIGLRSWHRDVYAPEDDVDDHGQRIPGSAPVPHAHEFVGWHETARSFRAQLLPRRPQQPRWEWSGLDGEMLAEAWADLNAWVLWLVATCEEEDRWPTCWYRHADLVTELAALRSWHRDLHAPEDDVDGQGRRIPGTAPVPLSPDAVAWHEACRRVVEAALARCRCGHREPADVVLEGRRQKRAEMLAGLEEHVTAAAAQPDGVGP